MYPLASTKPWDSACLLPHNKKQGWHCLSRASFHLPFVFRFPGGHSGFSGAGRQSRSDAREALGVLSDHCLQQIVSLQLQSNLLLAQSSASVLFAIEMSCPWAAGKGMRNKDAGSGGRMQVSSCCTWARDGWLCVAGAAEPAQGWTFAASVTSPQCIHRAETQCHSHCTPGT